MIHDYNPSDLLGLLSMQEVYPSRSDLEGWTLAQCKEARDWAMARLSAGSVMFSGTLRAIPSHVHKHYKPAPTRPRVVCLCGSTRFGEAWRKARLEETLAGKIVLTIGCDFKSDDALGMGPDVKARLDELHLRKIDMADEVLMLNVGGYLGGSSRRELAYAQDRGKYIRWLETDKATA